MPPSSGYTGLKYVTGLREDVYQTIVWCTEEGRTEREEGRERMKREKGRV